ncbi:uncharacterized protein K02A2.6-like [Ornithodoros turicata]|uniref:uncharacterized protein K02A2.6-like n=1 Tax=Ornithodoros turicata TaxID=34597 RepID=UPI0031389019
MSHPVSANPWEKIGVDLMECAGRHFLVTVDYLSNFWKVDELRSTTSDAVIRKLKAHFGRYGILITVFTDNGPQFASQQSTQFANEWDFRHHTSSPHYPQSNGMVESAVKMAKKLITKALESGREPQLAFLDYRNTPQQGTQMSPAQAFLGRRTRTTLPTTEVLLQPRYGTPQIAKQAQQRRSATYYNKNAKQLSELQPGQTVRVHPVASTSKWKLGTTTRKSGPRSYEVRSEGQLLRRNRVHVREVPHHEKKPNEPISISQRCSRPNQPLLDHNDLLDTEDKRFLSKGRMFRDV